MHDAETGGGEAAARPAHREDIDGLRAVAVLAVVCNHAHFAFVPGGYVGVDVFFVISGYLIASIIGGELRIGTFSLARFYERRVRRIMPALLLVLTVVTSLALTIMMPQELTQFGRSLFYTLIFVSNVYFNAQSGYFAPQAEELPLLHTWSLAVEEQFYILFPLLMLFLAKYTPARVTASLMVLLAISLAASIAAVQLAPDAAFYLTPLRAWELLAGAVLAIGTVPRIKNRLANEALAAAGLVMILYSAACYSDATPFPGLAAVPPVLGTCLIIYSGTDKQTATSRLLACQPLVFVGLISYSLYLWHWPLIVLGEYVLLRPFSAPEAAAMIVLSMLLAASTWRYVEQPFRKPAGVLPRLQIFLAAGAVALALVAVAAGAHLSKGLPFRLPDTVRQIAASDSGGPRHLGRCKGHFPGDAGMTEACRIGATGGSPPVFIVWGDSHALALSGVLDDLARRNGQAGIIAAEGGCPPLFGLTLYGKQTAARCYQFNERLLRFLSETGIRHVVIVARWPWYANGTRFGNEAGDAIQLSAEGIAGNAGELARLLKKTVMTLLDQGVSVSIVGPVPEAGFAVSSVMARVKYLALPAPKQTPAAVFAERQEPVWKAFSHLNDMASVRIYYPHEALCGPHGCRYENDGLPLYVDEDHLNGRGGREIAHILEPIFRARAATLPVTIAR